MQLAKNEDMEEEDSDYDSDQFVDALDSDEELEREQKKYKQQIEILEEARNYQ